MDVILYVRNSSDYLRTYLVPTMGRMEALYPGVTFSYFIYENDSTDDTVEVLRGFAQGERADRCHIFTETLGLDHVGSGTSYARIHRMATVRNRLLEQARGMLRGPWTLLIDSDVYFDEGVLHAMFQYEPAKQGIGMMTCHTIELFENTGSDEGVPDSVPYLTQNHYYDTFAFIDIHDRMHYPNCISGACERPACKNARRVGSGMGVGGGVVDVRSAWGGFVLVATAALRHPGVCWKTTGYHEGVSLCEHIHFCDTLRATSQQRIVLLNSVQCYWYPKHK